MGLLSLLSIIFTAIITTILPLGLIIYMKRKYNVSILYFLVGVMVFTIFQIVLRIPLLQWLSGQFWFNIHIMSNKVLYILFLSVTAGIFEEVGRFLAFKFILTNNREWENGIAFGIGHGGIEAIALVGLNYLTFIAIALNLNFKWFGNLMSKIPNLSTVTSLLLESEPSIFLLAGFERIFVIIIHIGFSLLVLNGIRKGKISHLFYAILFHSLLDFSVIFASYNIWIVEAIVGITAGILLYYIKSRKYVWKFLK